ncbi:hypothetical protein NL676_033649 [Syzygium grande]|nr:hypothetical protein NL676_033649 [Syzygium grande]
MLGRRPFIGKLSDLLISGCRGAGPPPDPTAAASPRSPLDFKVQSPRGPRGYDLGCGVGLGIVAALERSGEVVPGGRRRCVRCGPGLPGRRGAAPAPVVGKGKGCAGIVVGGGGGGGFEDMEAEDWLENYTYVTCHGPDRSFTKVYYDGGLDWPSEHERPYREGAAVAVAGGDYGVSKAPSGRIASEEAGVPAFQTLDFLSSCHLCGKKLHDRDIYMYRGEKAFCSTECRSRQITMDERKEQKCRNEASKAADLSSSPYTKDRIFSTGIVAI